MNYCKITTDKQAMLMPNPYKCTIANATDNQKALIAQLDNWLEMVYTEAPTYNPETEYLREWWQAEDVGGIIKAVQNWDVLPIETPSENEE